MFKSYDLIKKLEPKIGEDEARDLIEFIEAYRGDGATKADIELLKIDGEKTRNALGVKIDRTKSEQKKKKPKKGKKNTQKK
ncbi:MAG: hypothetical protein M5U24_04085 [Candidatus Kuenenia sp.]|uniref:hypothetical protein n=1 Tax=Candidatus Kuenenia sp. TaxID=2499824 RepID=UPI0022BEDC2C|nr:hypothetical protein [Candidatus Kuenenia sp.]MCZ7621649.1 hypothetical protein [Candidatus Kuenenia sp.]